MTIYCGRHSQDFHASICEALRGSYASSVALNCCETIVKGLALSGRGVKAGDVHTIPPLDAVALVTPIFRKTELNRNRAILPCRISFAILYWPYFTGRIIFFSRHNRGTRNMTGRESRCLSRDRRGVSHSTIFHFGGYFPCCRIRPVFFFNQAIAK